MRFWARVRLNGVKNSEHLIRAFFKEFNPNSSITVRGREAKVEIVFNETPPMGIIEAINHCEVIEFNFGKALEEYNEDEVKEKTSEQTEQIVEEETPEQIEQVVEEGTSEQIEQVVKETIFEEPEQPPKKKRGRPDTKKAETTKNNVVEPINVPILEELAEKATSFEHFVKLVAEWCEMDKRQEFFENLAIAATDVNKMSWKELEKALSIKGVVYSQWDKIQTGRQISEKLKDYSVTVLPLLNAMAQYKDYSFRNENSEEKNGAEQVEEEVVLKEEQTVLKNRVKMECMPEIPHFEEILGSVDKTQPIEDRVRYVLTAMGWNKKNKQEQQEIFEIANTAVRLGRMEFDIIFLKINIPMESSMKARMTFSKFINDFASEYNADKKVKLLEFLKQMQEIIMYQTEIESFTDFTD